MTSHPTAREGEVFLERLLHFINENLPQWDRRGRVWPVVDADASLFGSGLLDSMSILHLIAFVEQATGKVIPDRQVVMRNFQTARVIATTFGGEFRLEA